MELTKEVVQDIIQTEMKNATNGMISQADFEAKMTALKADADAKQKEAIDKAIKEVDAEIKAVLKTQGEALRQIQEKGGKTEKTLRDVLEEKKDFFHSIAKEGAKVENTTIPVALKTLTAASLTGASGNRSDLEINAIVKNSPFVMALLRNRITMPANNEGFYVYYEQTLNTNNTSLVAENGVPAQNNVYTWEKKSIQSYEVKAKTVVSQRQMYDMQFITDTVNGLMVEDWVLKVEDLLINSTANLFGLLHYATEFDFASATKSKNPNLMDVLRKVKAQITKQGKNRFKPNLAFMAVDAVEEMAGTKNDFGDYIMPNWAMGGDITFSGVQIIENELANDNQVVMGDMSKAKLIIWDDMMLRVFYDTGDESAGRVTIQVEGRMNLLVKTNDKPAIVKVTDLAAAIAGIEEIGA
jgi:hypothetical protein